MQKKELRPYLIWTGVIIIFLCLSIGFISYKQNGEIDLGIIATIIGSGFAAFIMLIKFFLSLSFNKDFTDIKEDNQEIKNRLSKVEKHNIIFQKSLDDIKEGNIEHDKTMYFIESSFKHIKEINDLCTTIDAETNDILDEHVNLNEEIKAFLNEHNSGISNIIKAQYERNFDDIRISFFKTRLKNNLKKSINTSLLDSELKNDLKNDIDRSICKYVEDLKLIIKIENGERRKEFRQMTLRLIEKINKRSINITEKLAA